VVEIVASASGLGPLALIGDTSLTLRGFIQMLFLGGVVITTLPAAGLLEDLHEAAQRAKVEAQTLALAKSLAVLGHWQMDRETGQFSCSDEIYRIHGLEPGTVDPTEYMLAAPYHPDDAEMVRRARQHALETGEGYDLTLRLTLPTGEQRFTRSRANCLKNADGEVIGLFGVQQDISAEVRLKREQTATLERLTLAESLSGIGYWRMSLPDGELEWSDAMFAIHGLKPGEAKPQNQVDLVDYDSEDVAEAERKTVQLLETGIAYETRLRFTLAEGDTRTAHLKVNLERDSDGQPVALFGVVQDITESVRRTDELAKMVDTLKLAEETAGVGHWRYCIASQKLVWSDVVYDIYGLQRGSDYGGLSGALSLFHAEDQARLMAAVRHAAATGEPFSLKLNLVRADKETRVVVTQGRRETSADGRSIGIIGVIQDVTEHDRAAARIAQSEAQYRGLADRSTDLIISYGLDGIVTYVSPAIRDLKGLEPSEVVGRPVTSLIHPDDVAELSQRLGAFIVSGGTGVHPSQYRSFDAEGNIRWYEARASLIRDAMGRVTAVQDIVRDVTETKAMETALIEARDKAESAARSKSEFLANMSHELRTPLTSVIGFSGLLQASTTLGDTERRFVNRIATSSEALLVVINDILDYSKLEANAIELEPLPFTPQQLVEDVTAIVENQRLAKGLALNVAIDADVPTLLVGDAGRLRQVLLNLVSNAIKFTATGSVTVALSGRMDAQGWLLRAEVVDTGIGIEPDKVDELFERFTQADASTTRNYGGTGLGLAISRRLMELMGGTIEAFSTPGEGSTFWFEVPLGMESDVGATLGARPVVEVSKDEGSRLVGARVLLADDSPANRELVTMVLRGLGLIVETVRDGAEAVAAVQSGQHDLVLMDIQMPVMDGVTASRNIRRMKGSKGRIPILALTANSGEDKVNQYLAAGMNGHVTKPLKIGDLAKAIGECLPHKNKRGHAA
jgi:PAS domain S-box